MDALKSIGTIMSGDVGKAISGITGLATTGAGLIGNLGNQRALSQAEKMAKANAMLTPQQLAERVNAATLPLNRNLVQAITGNVNANMAEQGLSQAPGLMQTALAQALAGPEQIQQQAAMELVMKQLGLPAEYANLIPKNTDMSSGLAMLMKQLASFPQNIPSTPTATPPIFSQNPNPAQLAVSPDFNPDTTGTYNFGDLTPPQAPYGGTLNFGGQ